MAPLTTMRQVYMLWAYTFLGISVLAKGPPGSRSFALVAAFHVILLGRWRDLYDGKFEIKRGLLLMIVVVLAVAHRHVPQGGHPLHRRVL